MSILFDDINSVVAQKDLFTFLDKTRVLVTGATGLVGSMMTIGQAIGSRCLALALWT